MDTTCQCPYCGETVEVTVDPGGGEDQTYVEDCPVCCRPWTVRVELDEEDEPRVLLRRQDE